MFISTSTPVGMRSIAMSVFATCMSVCLSARISQKDMFKLHDIFSTCHTCSPGLVIIWQKCNAWCTFCFVSDVMFAP